MGVETNIIAVRVISPNPVATSVNALTSSGSTGRFAVALCRGAFSAAGVDSGAIGSTTSAPGVGSSVGITPGDSSSR